MDDSQSQTRGGIRVVRDSESIGAATLCLCASIKRDDATPASHPLMMGLNRLSVSALFVPVTNCGVNLSEISRVVCD